MKNVSTLVLVAVSAVCAGTLASLAEPGIATYAAILLAPLVAWLFFRWPELPLVLFVFAGSFKSALPLPVDPTLLLGLVLVVLIVARLLRGEANTTPLAVWFFLALALVVLVGTVGSLAPQYGVDKSVRFAALGGLTVIAGTALVSGAGSVRRVGWTVLVVGLTMSVAGILGGGDALYGGSYAAFGSDTISLGRAAAYALTVAAVALLHRSRNAWWAVPAIGVCSVALLGSGSRGPLLALALVVLVLLVMRIVSGRAMPIIVTVIVMGALLVTAAGSGLIPERSLARIGSRITVNARVADPTRVELFSAGSSLSEQNPVLGAGTGSFAALGTGFDYPHNIVLEVASENGLVGVALLIAFVALALGASMRVSVAEKSFESELLLAFGVLGLANALVSSDLNGHRMMYLALAAGAVYLTASAKVRAVLPVRSRVHELRSVAGAALPAPIRPTCLAARAGIDARASRDVAYMLRRHDDAKAGPGVAVQ